MPELPILTAAYDAAYAAISREIAHLPPRQQSNEVLRHVARFCQAQEGRACDHLAEAAVVSALAAAAADPFTLTRFIADINAQSEDDDFPAARLDPRNRHGWAHPQPGHAPRIISRPPWQQPTDGILDELRRHTGGFSGERLHAQLAANIEARTTPAFIVPENPGLDSHAHHSVDAQRHMMPVTIAAHYLLCFEQRIRDLETALEEEGRSQYAER
jgi:hypothetical protein